MATFLKRSPSLILLTITALVLACSKETPTNPLEDSDPLQAASTTSETGVDEAGRRLAIEQLSRKLKLVNQQLFSLTSGHSPDLLLTKSKRYRDEIKFWEGLEFGDNANGTRGALALASLTFVSPTKVDVDIISTTAYVTLYTSTNATASLSHSANVGYGAAFYTWGMSGGPKVGTKLVTPNGFTIDDCTRTRLSVGATSWHYASAGGSSLSQPHRGGDACGDTDGYDGWPDGHLDLEQPAEDGSFGTGEDLCSYFEIPFGCYEVWIDGKYEGDICCDGDY